MTQGSCWHLVQIRTSNRQVQKWYCTIATVSSQNPTPHNMITVHKHSCSKSAETPIFTTYIVQIPARSCGYFRKCTHACSLIACDDNLLQHQTGNSMSIGCFHPGIAWVFHVFQHLVQICAQQDRHFPKTDLHHCNSIQSEQHNIRHDKRERMFRNRMLTMHIAQILVRFGGFFPQAAGAMRYFPENALHEYHKEVSTPRQITRPCTRQPLAAEVRLRAHSITSVHLTSTDQAPVQLQHCSRALLLARVAG